ncbi:MAG: hypothetical protein QOJ25_1283 [Solirubrobacteraceae bacterium]|jgi:uncharacterized membrane protein|nr:hypothetical protein [Solirubrobacteraceae bacterium]
MSFVEDRRIEDLERVARSLTTRVDRLERTAVGPDAPPPTAAPGAPAAPLPTVDLSIPPPLRPGAAAAPAEEPRQRFEDLLGGRLLAWLGGAAVVTGIVLFFAYAISRGWIGETARVAGGSAACLAFLGLGIWLHERRNRTEAARTVVAAAVAGLFITVVVASRVYAVIPTAAGFALALAVGAVASAFAVRWNARVIAAIGIGGALLAPVLVGAPDDGSTLAILFASALSAVAVLLWRRWDWLGFGVLLVCAPQWLTWLLAGQSVGGGLLALVAFGALGHVAALGFELRLPESKLRASSSLLLALNAAVLAIGGHAALADAGRPIAAALWIAALAAAHLLLAFLAGRSARVPADIRLLLATLGVVLGDVAFALLAHGPVLALGFAAAGVLFARLVAHTGKQPHTRAVSELGLGAHIAGALLVAVGQATGFGVLGQGDGSVTATVALASVAAGAFTSARLTTASSHAWRVLLDIVALAVTAYLTANNVGGAGLVIAWALEAVALAQIARRSDDDLASIASLMFLAGAGIHALAIEAPPRALALGAPDLAAAAAALGACVAGSAIIARARLIIFERETVAGLSAAAALAFLYLASVAIVTAFQPTASQSAGTLLDLTVRQEGQMILSCLWALAGVGTLLLGLRGDRRVLRLGGLGLLLITAGKVFLYDLSTLDSGYRIGSFIALGLLLLLGAYAYQRLRPPASAAA